MKKSLLLLGVSAAWFSAPATAVEVTANAGVVSEYVFRGIPSSDGKAAAQGGIDVTQRGFYAGIWGSSVDFDGFDGIEIDYYGGYGFTVGEVDLSLGATLYTYTDDADDDYTEVNLGAAWKWFSLDFAKGEYDNFGGPTLDYDFVSVSGEYEGAFVTFGSFGDDFDGDYLEIGYGDTLSVGGEDLFDWSISWINSDDELLIGTTSENRLIFGITKSFGVYED